MRLVLSNFTVTLDCHCYANYWFWCKQGTNFGMKAHSAAVKPTMNLDTAAKALNTQADLKAAELDERVIHEFQKPEKDWSSYPTAPYSTSTAEGNICHVMSRFRMYDCRRVGQDDFECKYQDQNMEDEADSIEVPEDVPDDDDFSDVPIPLFWRVRKLKITADGEIVCDCCCYHHSCMIYEHHAAVADLCYTAKGRTFEGFHITDLPPRHCSAYMYYGFRKETPDQLQYMFDCLLEEKRLGPNLGMRVPDCLILPFEPPFTKRPAIDRLKNYCTEKVKKAMSKVTRFNGREKTESKSSGDSTTQNTSWDSMFSQTYDPDDELMADELLQSLQRSLEGVDSGYEGNKFNPSLNDWQVENEVRRNLCTRDLLKQQWEEVCAAADEVGCEGTEKLSLTMRQFQGWCLQQQAKRAKVGEGLIRVKSTRNIRCHDSNQV